MLATLVDRRALTETVAHGRGRLCDPRERAVDLMSWIPLARGAVDTESYDAGRDRALGLVVDNGRGAAALARQLAERLPALSIRQVEPSALVSADARRTGLMDDVVAWAGAFACGRNRRRRECRLVGATGPTDHVSGTLSALDRRVVAAVPPGGNWRDLPADFPSNRIHQIRASAAAGEGSRSTYYGRLRPDAPSYTVSTYISRPGNGCFIHPTADRLITIREAARLQSFPDRHPVRRLVPAALHPGRQRRATAARLPARRDPAPRQRRRPLLRRGRPLDRPRRGGAPGCAGRRQRRRRAGGIWAERRRPHVARRSHRPGRARPRHCRGQPARWRSARSAGRGPPCQGFSTAGLCLADDPRNQLLHHFVDAVERLRPRRVMVENVLRPRAEPWSPTPSRAAHPPRGGRLPHRRRDHARRVVRRPPASPPGGRLRHAGRRAALATAVAVGDDTRVSSPPAA